MRHKKSLETKYRISQCALDLFAQSGIMDISVEEITEKAQISKPTFYYHYSSKYELLNEMIHRYDDEFYGNSSVSFESRSVEMQLCDLLEKGFVFIQEKIGVRLIREFYQSGLSDRTSLQGMPFDGDRIFHEIVTLVEEAQAQGVFPSERSARQIAEYTLCAVNGILYTWCASDNSFDLATNGTVCLKLFIKGICAT